jgi:hypothetical protein
VPPVRTPCGRPRDGCRARRDPTELRGFGVGNDAGSGIRRRRTGPASASFCLCAPVVPLVRTARPQKRASATSSKTKSRRAPRSAGDEKLRRRR